MPRDRKASIPKGLSRREARKVSVIQSERPRSLGEKVKRMKTHSGAKKRFKLKSSGKIKRGQARKRHRLSNKSSKRKRLLGAPAYVSTASEYQITRCLVP